MFNIAMISTTKCCMASEGTVVDGKASTYSPKIVVIIDRSVMYLRSSSSFRVDTLQASGNWIYTIFGSKMRGNEEELGTMKGFNAICIVAENQFPIDL